MTRLSCGYRSSTSLGVGGGLLGVALWLAIFGFFVNLSRLLFQYVLWSIVGHDIPWYADTIGGLFCNAFIVPVAVICWILRLCGIEAPFFHI